MNTSFLVTRRACLAGTLTVSLSLGIAAAITPRPASAHEAKCPICKLDVVQDTEKLDNETAIRAGRKRIEYRCVYCALQDAGSFNGDLTLLAPSEVKGKPVVLSRKDGKWSVQPETAVFVGTKVDHRSCQVGYRALTGKASFEKWLQANPDVPKSAKPLSLSEMLEVAKSAK